MKIAKITYFTYFAALATIFPFLTLHYKALHLTSQQIGLLGGIAPVVMLLAAPLWGGLADVTQRHRWLLLGAIVGLMVTIASFLVVHSFFWLIPVVIVYAFFSAPIGPLIDSSVLALLGERRQEYGRQRVWGAVGWGLVATMMGGIVDRFGLVWAFYGGVLMLAIHLAVTSRLPIAPTRLGSSYWQGLRQLLADPAWLILLLTLFVNGIGMSFTNNFLFLYVQQMQGSETLMGLAILTASISEMPAFFFANHLLDRWGARGLLVAGLVAQVVRLAAYALMPAAWWILPINLLHGLTFSAMWVAAVSYANEKAPPGLGATVQSLLSAVTMGLAGLTGALLGGLLFDWVGPPVMFGIASAMVLLGLALFVLRAGIQITPSRQSAESLQR